MGRVRGRAAVAAGAICAVALAACGGGGANRSEAASTKGVRLQQVAKLEAPLYGVSAPGDRQRFFVVEQAGQIKILRGARKNRDAFLDIRPIVRAGGEQGLLSVAFPPDYQRSGLFYVYFTTRAGNQRLVEYHRRDADHADRSSARTVLEMADRESNHNGGQLRFGPDGLLYVGTGDGGGGGDQHGTIGNAQDLGSLLGKILRIDPRRSGGHAYTIPDDNPFLGRDGARGEIYAYGLRNPWRFVFAPGGGLVIADVGQDAWEELDAVPAGGARGANFGWRPYEGTARFMPGEDAPGRIAPVLVRGHGAGWCSIIGGEFVTRAAGVPALTGRYLLGDFCHRGIESGRVAGSAIRAVRGTGLKVSSLSSFGKDGRGRVYAISNEGPVYRIVGR